MNSKMLKLMFRKRTDKFIALIDDRYQIKEKEIMTV